MILKLLAAVAEMQPTGCHIESITGAPGPPERRGALDLTT
jgi:hypothetical protein